jgi:hypothetical protein
VSDLTHSPRRPDEAVPPTPLRDGAADMAPTSPHATPRREREGEKRRRNGPERFWSSWRVRVALVGAFVASITIHYVASPWTLMPTEALQLKDLEGDLAIPVDLLEGPEAPAAPPKAAAPPTPPPDSPKGEGPGHAAVDAGVKPPRDAGPPHDAAVADAEARDGGPSRDAGSEGGALSDAAVAAGGGVDGGAGNLEGVSGQTLVTVAVNVGVIRTNTVGQHLGPLLKAIPQWDEFMSGTDVDPIKDVDWIYIFGPGLIHTENDAVLVRYNMTDARAARDIELLSHKDANGGAYDAGVPGVKAWRGHADRAWRIFLLPRPHLAAMVPPSFAPVAARAFSQREPRVDLRPGEAVRFTVATPNHAIPWQLPPGLTELRFWVIPRADGGADAYGELDAPDEAAAEATARRLKEVARNENSLAVKLVTRGLFDDVEVSSDGKTAKVHLPATQDQLAAVYDLIAAFLGVNVPPIASSLPSASAPPPAAKAPLQ